MKVQVEFSRGDATVVAAILRDFAAKCERRYGHAAYGAPWRKVADGVELAIKAADILVEVEVPDVSD